MRLIWLHNNFVKGTPPQGIITVESIVLCHLTFAVIKGIGLEEQKVYVNSKMLKHLYDKRPAEEYEFILNNLHKIVKYPDKIYENRDQKRGDYCFVKKIYGLKYLSSIEVNKNNNEIATVFRLRKESYLNNYKEIWSWKGDNPSS